VVEAARTGDESAVEKVRAEVKYLMDAYPAPGLPVG
jgi:glycine hydroxymethyltransferase